MDFSSQSPQTGQVYFNMAAYNDEPQPVYVTIPSNGSSLFQSCILEFMTNTKLYRHNPLKRVKFISILSLTNGMEGLVKSHNPLKRVKFISMLSMGIRNIQAGSACHNPLKRVKFISIKVYKIAGHFKKASHNPLKRVKFISITE